VRRRALAVSAAAALPLGFVLAVANPASADLIDGDSGIVVFQFTGGQQYWTVPAGVTSATFLMEGAQGGHAGGFSGGDGGASVGTVAVTPGEQFQIDVGGVGGDASIEQTSPYYGLGGVGGFNGGGKGGNNTYDVWAGAGGGGASDVRTAPFDLTDRVVVAGGGGGAAADSQRPKACGSANVGGAFPGAGGGAAGAAAANPAAPFGGGTQTAGGFGGPSNVNGLPGFDGTSGSGGAGEDSAGTEGQSTAVFDAGGGGGGGWYGGGGGGSGDCGGGAGSGGSGHVAMGGSTQAGAALSGGNGWVEVRYRLSTIYSPTVTVPLSIRYAAQTRGGSLVQFLSSATDAQGNALTPTCTQPSGSVFPIGSTTDTCQATDANGNTGSASFQVVISPAPLSVYAPTSPPTAPLAWGLPVPPPTPTFVGLYPGESQPVNAPVCTTAAHQGSEPGYYPISCTGNPGDPAYAETYYPGNLVITQAPTTLVAVPLAQNAGHPAAVLTRADTGAAIPGQVVSFYGPGNAGVCSASTNAEGVAMCASATITAGFYSAVYPLTPHYQAATAYAKAK
jgi:hypothetical protein